MTAAALVHSRLLVALFSLAGLAFAACSEASGAPNAAPESTAKAAVSTACGSKGQPDCPLQGWMKATVQQYLNAGDKERLAESLGELAKHAPQGYEGWEAAAKAGAEAAKAGDIAGVRSQCQGCHQKNRARFRTEMRNKKLF